MKLNNNHKGAISSIITRGDAGGFSPNQIAEAIVVYVNEAVNGDYLRAFDAAVDRLSLLRKK